MRVVPGRGGHRPVVFLVMYRPKVQVRLQLTVRVFDFTSEIEIVPCGLLVKIGHVRPQEKDAAPSVHILRHCDTPEYVCHVPWILRGILYVVDDIVLGDGRIFLFCSSYTLNNLPVGLRADFFKKKPFAFWSSFSKRSLNLRFIDFVLSLSASGALHHRER